MDGTRGRTARMGDLARACGVSVATVSRALADRPGVRPELRERVRQAARALGYALPSAVAGRTAILAASEAAMVDAARSQFTLHVLAGLRERAAALGMAVETRTLSGPDSEAALARAAAAPGVAGVLLLTPESDAAIDRARALPAPVVLINADDPAMRLSSVAPCNRSAAVLATDCLVRRGHRRILFLTRPGRRTIARRHEGWAERLAADGLPHGPEMVVEVADWLPALAAEAVAARLARRDFTAILAAGDSLAAGALLALGRAGVAVPGEVSVMGFDGLPQCDLLSPPLSAVEIPMAAIGAAALDLLRDAVEGRGGPARRIELACRIVERASTGPAPRPAPTTAPGTTPAGADCPGGQ